MKFLIWNVDRARLCSSRPLPRLRAFRLADLLEQRVGEHMIVVPA